MKAVLFFLPIYVYWFVGDLQSCSMTTRNIYKYKEQCLSLFFNQIYSFISDEILHTRPSKHEEGHYMNELSTYDNKY